MTESESRDLEQTAQPAEDLVPRAEMEAALARQAGDFDAQLRQLRLDYAVERALTAAGAINPVTVRPLLADLLAAAEPDENGQVPGLQAAVEALAADDATAFLFRSAPAQPVQLAGAAPAGTVSLQQDSRAAALEARLAEARQSGNLAAAVQVRREAAEQGIVISG